MSTKKKLEEQKKKEEEERLAAVHKDFLDTFSNAPKLDKTWVKAGTAENERRGERSVKREIYKPTSKLAELSNSFKSHQTQAKDDPPAKPEVPRRKSTKVSNLEKFKEELKAMQEERDERKKLRTHIKDCEEKGITPTLLTSSGKPSRFEVPRDTIQTLETSLDKDIYGNSGKAPAFDNDSTTTNIYCGNISPKMTEQDLCEVFGKFGPLASIKIMYPRTEEERAKNRNTGFVGFMKRSDAEDAFDSLKGKNIMGYEMRLSWGKCIPIPPRPIYIPASMVKETLPPPPSGLPFNAQPPDDWQPERDQYGNTDLTKNLDQTEVKIVIPTDRMLLCLIHRMVEYVVREGPLFEAMIMNREINNPRFRFLFDNQLPAHCYYRWKLFSILQGDEPHVWHTKPFQMFDGGSYWIPPKMNPYMQKQMKETEKNDLTTSSKRATLSERQRDRLGDILREISCDRIKIGDAMVWCLEHAEAAEEIVEIITDSLSILGTPITKKLGRLYVVSDILHNSSAKLPNVSYYRKYFESALPTIFKSFNEVYEGIEGRLTAENFKQKIMSCFRVWEDWVIYPIDHLIKCQNIFLGLQVRLQGGVKEEPEDDVDGAPISPKIDEADINGEPISGNGAKSGNGDDDIDGVPMSDDIDGQPINSSRSPFDEKPKFAASKWETIDEDVVKAQAMTTSKWELLEEPITRSQSNAAMTQADYADIDGDPINSSADEDDDMSKSSMSGLLALSAAYTPKQKKQNLEMTEKRRSKLRDIELKVMKYQDELEAGRRSRKAHMTLSDQVEAYRRKLLQKEQDEAEMEFLGTRSPIDRSSRKKKYDRSRSSSPHRYSRRSRSRSSSRGRGVRGRRSRSRSKSPKRRRSRSRSSERYRGHKKYRQ